MGASGPKLGDYMGRANAALQSADRAAAYARDLRAQGNEEHARDYDGIERSMKERAARLVVAATERERGGIT